MNLKGGYILLSLCAISLALSGEPVTITNADVLKKLSEFQMYVGTDEFKSQPKVGLKPVLVQYRSSESKINGVILCKCGFDTNNKKLIISGTDGEKLSIQIECVFIDNPEDVKVTPYVLQSAKVTAYRGVIGDLDILGDLDIDGDLTVDGITSKGIANTGNIANIGDIGTTGKITGGEIVENMSGYSYQAATPVAEVTQVVTYIGAVKNGNKLTVVMAKTVERTDNVDAGFVTLGYINIPKAVGDKLYPVLGNWLSMQLIYCGSGYNTGVSLPGLCIKNTDQQLRFNLYNINSLTLNTTYYVRFEVTFLLSENVAE